MIYWKLILTILACLHAAQGFTCPDDSHPFYHADVYTGCQVYHLCINSQLQTFTCPSGQAFNSVTSTCEDTSTVNCYETMDDHSHHHHHKRSIENHHKNNTRELRVSPTYWLLDGANKAIYKVFLGNGTTFTSKVLIPVFYDMIKHEHTRKDALSVWRAFECSFLPVVKELGHKIGSVDIQQDRMIRISKDIYTKAINKFLFEIRPIIQRTVDRYSMAINKHIKVLRRLSENVPLLKENFDFLGDKNFPHIEELRSLILKFLKKHGEHIKTSTDSHIHFFPLFEILLDMHPIVESMSEIFAEYFDGNMKWWDPTLKC